MFKLNYRIDQESFYILISVDDPLSGVFKSNNSFIHKANILFGRIRKSIFNCFSQIRIISGGKVKRCLTENQILLKKKLDFENFLEYCTCLNNRSKARKMGNG